MKSGTDEASLREASLREASPREASPREASRSEEQEAILEKLERATAEHEVAERRQRERLLVKWKAGASWARGDQVAPHEAGQPGEREGGPGAEKAAKKPRGFSIPGTRMPVKH